MPRALPVPSADPARALESPVEEWPLLRVRVPPAWKRWLEEAAEVRALTVSALVRQCIRELMISRHATRGD